MDFFASSSKKLADGAAIRTLTAGPVGTKADIVGRARRAIAALITS